MVWFDFGWVLVEFRLGWAGLGWAGLSLLDSNATAVRSVCCCGPTCVTAVLAHRIIPWATALQTCSLVPNNSHSKTWLLIYIGGGPFFRRSCPWPLRRFCTSSPLLLNPTPPPFCLAVTNHGNRVDVSFLAVLFLLLVLVLTRPPLCPSHCHRPPFPPTLPPTASGY